ncbi:MAG: Acylphosphatase [Candidatus Solibacter sp.]|nr:Acylphosphatase [Candidatus Solibacter sp.]
MVEAEQACRIQACRIKVRGVVQGVGFRPFVYRLAHGYALSGWVLNEGEGVEIHIEGEEQALESFVDELVKQAPSAASIAAVDVQPAGAGGLTSFTIRESELRAAPSAGIAPDLPVCSQCVRELFDPEDRRFHYPYINCTECGPRYSILLALPYDRANTTMSAWEMDRPCSDQYREPSDRRFHAQPVACPACGPHYRLEIAGGAVEGDGAAISRAVQILRDGGIVAMKGLGGYHLACDAGNSAAVRLLRERKYRKEKPFAVMPRDLDTARELVRLSGAAEALLTSPARPIVLADARVELEGIAPECRELGVMLPYTPLHHLLFAAGAPDVLAMTSGNRSSEPIAYTDADARTRLSGIADALMIGERPIARRVDDSVARAGARGPVILRRSRGYAPCQVSRVPTNFPILALGADLKNAIALSVGGDVIVSQHIGDLEHFSAFEALRDTVRDLTAMYSVRPQDLVIAHDLHPEYVSTRHALELEARERIAVQHHEAHIASVIAEREAWNVRVLGFAWDGTGYGHDGSIQGSEVFAGSVAEGFQRVSHLRGALLPGGDAAARFPVQAAAGFLAGLDGLPDLTAPPFDFPERYGRTVQLLRRGMRTFPTTSAGRLFDTAAAIAGFTRPSTFEGQAAMWLEQLARRSGPVDPYPFPFDGNELDYRPLLRAMVQDRRAGRDPASIAMAFHAAIAQGIAATAAALRQEHQYEAIVLSGGVFQNELLLELLREPFGDQEVWTNHAVPPNDGGICLGQAALAAFRIHSHA